MNCKKYSFRAVEEKWRNLPIKKRKGSSKYVLEMFMYPSGRFHAGHCRNFTIVDVLARYLHLKGHNVFCPVGWDAFGLPAENAAIEQKIHPEDWTLQNIEQMRHSLRIMNYMYDWENELLTCSSDYYGHQQKLFIELYKKGLIEKKEDWVNWDPVAQTVLANEQVQADGTAWRSGAKVEKRKISQWFLKTSFYAKELEESLDDLHNWPEKIISMQRNWIGKSTGYLIKFGSLEVFTTRPETVFGCTFLAVSPESKVAEQLSEEKVKAYLLLPKEERELVYLGECTNPFSEEKIPLFLADYVISNYGTGIVMGVPAEDSRDRTFAEKYNLPIKKIQEDGKMINSEFLNGYSPEEAREVFITQLEQKTFYRLKDWCISRQRYWGCPIPFISCANCGTVPAEDLPVKLPYDVNFDLGGNPLNTHPTWKYVSCPRCSETAERETDTMDTFVDSSWYFLRFPFSKEKNQPFGYCSPVDFYVGGAEHAVLHLLYARFITKVFRDMKLVDFSEPFLKLLNQGTVCAPTFQGKESKKYYYPEDVEEKDGKYKSSTEEVIQGPSVKMSKSLKNVVDPVKIGESFGVDSLRLFILSDSPIEKEFEWSEDALFGCRKFLDRIWKTVCEVNNNFLEESEEFLSLLENYVWDITKDLERNALNLYVAHLRMMFNAIEKEGGKKSLCKFLLCLWPLCPALAEECNALLGGSLLADQHWNEGKPKNESAYVTMTVAINGKKKVIYEGPILSEDAIANLAKSHNIAYKTYVHIPGKVLNFIN